MTLPIEPTNFDPVQKQRISEFELQYKRDTELKKVKLHHHDFYELNFLITGDVVYTIEGKLYHLVPGDILLVSPRELHKLQINTKSEDYERYVLWINHKYLRRLSSEKTNLLQCFDMAGKGRHNQFRMNPDEQRGIFTMISWLYREMQEDLYGSDIMRENLLKQLLVAINRLAAGSETSEEDANRSNQVVSEIVDYIGEHYRDPLSLSQLAETFYVSKYYLSHEFNRQVGTGIHHYITKKRLLIARQFIAQGHKLKDVWLECGFGDYTGFYRAFKSEYGMSPREYARYVGTNE